MVLCWIQVLKWRVENQRRSEQKKKCPTAQIVCVEFNDEKKNWNWKHTVYPMRWQCGAMYKGRSNGYVPMSENIGL